MVRSTRGSPDRGLFIDRELRIDNTVRSLCPPPLSSSEKDDCLASGARTELLSTDQGGLRFLLAIGPPEALSAARELSDLAVTLRLNLVSFCNWNYWRATVLPLEHDFVLKHATNGITLTRKDVALILYMGEPAIPTLQANDIEYARAEHLALLMAIVALCGSESIGRLYSLCSGESDTVMSLEEVGTRFGIDPWFLPQDWCQAVLLSDSAVCRLPNTRGLSVIRGCRLSDRLSTPRWLIRRRKTFAFVTAGIVPPWTMSAFSVLEGGVSALMSFDHNILPDCNSDYQFTDRAPILVVANRGDSTASDFLRILHGLQAQPTFIDIEALCDEDGISVLANALKRYPVVLSRPMITNASRRFRQSTCHAAVLRLLQTAPSTVLNRPAASATNVSKVLHVMQLAAVGWAVPNSIATNDEEAAFAFVSQHSEGVVAKSCGSDRSVVFRLARQHFPRLSKLRNCPVLFQEAVSGVDYRIHVARHTVVVTRVTSGPASFQCAELDRAIGEMSVRTAQLLNLGLAGIDIRVRAADNQAIAFECNSMPAFTSFGGETSLAVARAIVGPDRS